MGLKSTIINAIARYTRQRILRESRRAVELQEKTFQTLLQNGSKTDFGKDHNFHSIKNHQDFIKHVPIRDYESLRPYIDEFTVFIRVKIDNLKELSNSIPLKVNKKLKKNNEIIKIIIDKKYL